MTGLTKDVTARLDNSPSPAWSAPGQRHDTSHFFCFLIVCFDRLPFCGLVQNSLGFFAFFTRPFFEHQCHLSITFISHGCRLIRISFQKSKCVHEFALCLN